MTVKEKRAARRAERAAKKNGEAPPVEQLVKEVEKLDLSASERNCSGVLTSHPLSRDVKVESFQLSFFGRELITSTNLELNFGRRYGLIGPNGSGKSTFLKALAAREVPIPDHIDIFLLDKEADPSELTAVDAVIDEAVKEQKV
jgi:ATP-binding cassette subfamily F protein 2